MTDPPPCFTTGTRYSGLLAYLEVHQTQTRHDVRTSVKDDSSEGITYFLPSSSRFYDHHSIFFSCSLVFCYKILSNCSSTVNVGFVKLSSDCLYGNRVFTMNIEFCCHVCCSNPMIFRHNRFRFTVIPVNEFWF
jgi:hypothetical protein